MRQRDWQLLYFFSLAKKGLRATPVDRSGAQLSERDVFIVLLLFSKKYSRTALLDWQKQKIKRIKGVALDRLKLLGIWDPVIRERILLTAVNRVQTQFFHRTQRTKCEIPFSAFSVNRLSMLEEEEEVLGIWVWELTRIFFKNHKWKNNF